MLKKILRNILLKKGLRKDTILPNIFYTNLYLKNIIVAIDTYVLMKSQYWPNEEIKNLQLQRIKEIVSHAYEKIPYWRDKFNLANVNQKNKFTWDEFSKIPITKRVDYKSNDIEYITDKSLFSKKLLMVSNCKFFI